MSHDVIVIGAGIAGASIAAHLARSVKVLLVEREARPGYHSTGRSAALFTEIYGNASIRALTRASRPFFFSPAADFTEAALVRPRGCLYIARQAQLDKLRAFAALPDVAPATRALSTQQALALCPALRAEYVAAALLEPDCSDIDVHALHQGYLRWFRRHRGELLNNAPVTSIEPRAKGFAVQAGAATYTATFIVNAAGAWADEIASLAGIPPVGLSPRRRTVVLIDPPPGLEVGGWPFVSDIAEEFYFKPEAGALFLSPADETPSEPTDAQPEDWDVAVAVERLETATTLEVGRPKARWAGLRTFAPDRTPVVGFAPQMSGFFWLAGQGGYGIQTAPALSRAAAALLLGSTLDPDLLAAGIRSEDLSPARFARGCAAGA